MEEWAIDFMEEKFKLEVSELYDCWWQDASQWTDLNETVELEHGSEETSQYESE